MKTNSKTIMFKNFNVSMFSIHGSRSQLGATRFHIVKDMQPSEVMFSQRCFKVHLSVESNVLDRYQIYMHHQVKCVCFLSVVLIPLENLISTKTGSKGGKKRFKNEQDKKKLCHLLISFLFIKKLILINSLPLLDY